MRALSSYCLAAFMIFMASCKKDSFLELLPLDKPSDLNFYSNEAELKLAINACYNDFQHNFGWEADLMTDISWYRETFPSQAIGRGEASPLTLGPISLVWTSHWKGIGKCNFLLANMNKAESVTSPVVYASIRSQARFLRALYYSYLIELYGDVPLVIRPLSVDSALDVTRTSKQQVVDFLLQDLEEAVVDLPLSYTPDDKAGATKGAALALKSRIALYNRRFDVAAKAATDLIGLKKYALHSNVIDLFQYKGQQSNNEVILEYQFLIGVRVHNQPQALLSRMTGGFSTKVPLQALVDSYECTDGRTIDKSPLYNPANPFSNRDPRLDQTILHDGMVFGDFVFSTNPAHLNTLNVKTGLQVANNDVRNAFASFSGYLWRKYADEADITKRAQSELSYVIIRYAEVLFNYAEAKIELNQIDASVLAAINQVRARAYGKTVDQVSLYPSITTLDQNELRKIVRRERKVELAGEGLRLFDIRRWNIAHLVMPGTIYGRPKGDFSLMGVPVLDENGHPNYSAYADKLKSIELRRFDVARDYLWPIPQKEVDLNVQFKQNPNY